MRRLKAANQKRDGLIIVLVSRKNAPSNSENQLNKHPFVRPEIFASSESFKNGCSNSNAQPKGRGNLFCLYTLV